MIVPKGYPIKRLIFFALLTALDILTTYIVLRHGWGREGNPISAKIISWGWGYLIFIKYLVFALLCLIIYRALEEKELRAINWTINFLVVLYSLVIVNNITIMVFHLHNRLF